MEDKIFITREKYLHLQGRIYDAFVGTSITTVHFCGRCVLFDIRFPDDCKDREAFSKKVTDIVAETIDQPISDLDVRISDEEDNEGVVVVARDPNSPRSLWPPSRWN